MPQAKKLIEVALPLDAINAARRPLTKSIRPSDHTLVDPASCGGRGDQILVRQHAAVIFTSLS